MSPDDGPTAEELMAELAADPEHQARQRQLDDERRRRGMEIALSLEPVLHRVRAHGVEVDDINALRRAPRRTFRKALPALLDALEDAPPAVLDIVAGTLARPDAAPDAAEPLMRAYLRRRTDDGTQWSLASALAEVADDRVAPALAEAVADRARGKSREMLVIAAGRLSPALGTPIVLAALDDADLDGHAVIAARELGAVEAAPRVRAVHDRERGWKREEAARTLAALGG